MCVCVVFVCDDVVCFVCDLMGVVVWCLAFRVLFVCLNVCCVLSVWFMV